MTDISRSVHFRIKQKTNGKAPQSLSIDNVYGNCPGRLLFCHNSVSERKKDGKKDSDGRHILNVAHGSSIITTKFSQSAVSVLEELSPTLKTTCGNCGSRKNIARELKSLEGLVSTKKRIANGGHREGAGAKHRATENDSKQNAY
ncbi:hypothetical protein TNCV_1817371 [Trichonephila clavipes]|nr:hypothetical protein TNCV_1817371 [Trichonephila clavipes]